MYVRLVLIIALLIIAAGVLADTNKIENRAEEEIAEIYSEGQIVDLAINGDFPQAQVGSLEEAYAYGSRPFLRAFIPVSLCEGESVDLGQSFSDEYIARVPMRLQQVQGAKTIAQVVDTGANCG